MIYCQEYGIVTGCKTNSRSCKIEQSSDNKNKLKTGGDTIRVCLFCLSTEFCVDESALFVRLRGVLEVVRLSNQSDNKNN
jgi:hypothetical protein